MGCSEGSTMPKRNNGEDLCGLNVNDSKCSFAKALGLTSLSMEDNKQEIFLAKCHGFSSDAEERLLPNN